MGGLAWVTLATNDSYSLGALVLAHSLKQVGTNKQLVVLITPGVTNAMRQRLAAVFNVVEEVNILDSKDEANLRLLKRPELGVTFTKLHCWRLTQFDKCVFLDADTLVLQNCDELFDREELSAAPDVGWPDCFNSGVFVYRPSNETYEKLVQFALEKGSFDGGDQGLLNLYFSDWSTKDINKHLPFIYNLCSTACYSYLPAFKQFGADAKIIHFIGASKPWLQYFNTETKKVQPSDEFRHLQGVLQYWWDIFCNLIHPNLSCDMARSKSDVSHTSISSPIPKNHDKPEPASTKNEVWDPWDEYDKRQSSLPPSEPINRTPVESHNTNAHDNTGFQNVHIPEPIAIVHQQHSNPPESHWFQENIPKIPENISHSSFQNRSQEPSNFSFLNPPREPSPPPPPPSVHTYSQNTFNPPPVYTHSQNTFNPPLQSPLPQLVHQETVFYSPPPNPPASHNSSHNSAVTVTEFAPNPPETIIPPVPPGECEVTATVCKETTLHTPFCEDKADGGLAGAFAQLTLGAPRTAEQSALDDHLRRQGWEVGNIDYLGRDSFDNIWSKICETLSAAPPQSVPKPKEPTPPPVAPQPSEKTVIEASKELPKQEIPPAEPQPAQEIKTDTSVTSTETSTPQCTSEPPKEAPTSEPLLCPLPPKTPASAETEQKATEQKTEASAPPQEASAPPPSAAETPATLQKSSQSPETTTVSSQTLAAQETPATPAEPVQTIPAPAETPVAPVEVAAPAKPETAVVPEPAPVSQEAPSSPQDSVSAQEVTTVATSQSTQTGAQPVSVSESTQTSSVTTVAAQPSSQTEEKPAPTQPTAEAAPAALETAKPIEASQPVPESTPLVQTSQPAAEEPPKPAAESTPATPQTTESIPQVPESAPVEPAKPAAESTPAAPQTTESTPQVPESPPAETPKQAKGIPAPVEAPKSIVESPASPVVESSAPPAVVSAPPASVLETPAAPQQAAPVETSKPTAESTPAPATPPVAAPVESTPAVPETPAAPQPPAEAPKPAESLQPIPLAEGKPEVASTPEAASPAPATLETVPAAQPVAQELPKEPKSEPQATSESAKPSQAAEVSKAATAEAPKAEGAKSKSDAKKESTQGSASATSPTPPPRKGANGGKKTKSKK